MPLILWGTSVCCLYMRDIYSVNRSQWQNCGKTCAAKKKMLCTFCNIQQQHIIIAVEIRKLLFTRVSIHLHYCMEFVTAVRKCWPRRTAKKNAIIRSTKQKSKLFSSFQICTNWMWYSCCVHLFRSVVFVFFICRLFTRTKLIKCCLDGKCYYIPWNVWITTRN